MGDPNQLTLTGVTGTSSCLGEKGFKGCEQQAARHCKLDWIRSV